MSMPIIIGTPICKVNKLNRKTEVYLRDNIGMSIGKRIREARKDAKMSQQELAAKVGLKQGSLSELETGESTGTTLIATFAATLGVNALWLETGKGNKADRKIFPDYQVISEDDTDLETGKIEYWNSKGSCGGGFLNHDELPKGHLVKEISFFRKYGTRPGNLFALYADGNSMADFIVDGDLVIFDKTKTDPSSGQIFLIGHPDGLRIKVLRRLIDGTWILESKNQDKRRFPDEVIPADQSNLLKIHGQFVYRQGG